MNERFLKEVLLVSPERAREFDLSIESPFFTSSHAHNVGYCKSCRDRVYPIQYKVGQVAMGEHLHPDEGGNLFLQF